MFRYRLVGLVGALLILPITVIAQQSTQPSNSSGSSIQRDPRAITILAQALSAAGGDTAISAIQDFTGRGTITYSWNGHESSGAATVGGRGSHQFRLDADLPEGPRSLVVDKGHGKLTESPGFSAEIPQINAVNIGILTFPYLEIAAALHDQSAMLSYLRDVEISGTQAHQIHIRRRLPPPDGQLDLRTRFTLVDYFIDAKSGLVIRIVDSTYPVDPSLSDYPLEIDLTDYRIFNGINVPMVVSEKLMGRTVWQLRLTDISFNTGIERSRFRVD